MNKLNKVKQVSFPLQLLEAVEIRLEETGVGFPEYIRHLVLNDTELIRDNYFNLTEEEEKEIEIALEDVDKGNYLVFRDKSDIDEYFKKIEKQKT